MPATNEDFIKKAFASGLTESQVRAAVAERNQRLSTPQPKKDERNIIQKIAGFAGYNAPFETISSIAMSPILSNTTGIVRSATDTAFQESNKLIQQAKSEQDPIKKKALIDQSRQIMSKSGNIADMYSGLVDKTSASMGIGDRQLDMSNGEFALRKGTETAAQVGSYLVPVAKGANWISRVGSGMVSGGTSAGLQGLAGASNTADSVSEGLNQIKNAAATGLIMGGALQLGIEGLRGAKNALTKIAKEDIVAKYNPNKAIRKEAYTRGIDIADEHINGGYTNDPAKNIEISSRKVTEANELFKKTIKENNNRVVDFEKTVNDILAEKLKAARLPSEKAELANWAKGLIDTAKQKYGSSTINLGATAEEKALAGASGFKQGGTVIEQTIGEADATLHGKLRQLILDNLPKKERVVADNLLRKQELGIFMNNMNKEAIISKIPKSLAQKIGRLFFPTAFARETAGNVAQFGVDALATPKAPVQNPNLLQQLGSSAGKVVKGALGNPKTYINPTIAAMQRAIENTKNNKLPENTNLGRR